MGRKGYLLLAVVAVLAVAVAVTAVSRGGDKPAKAKPPAFRPPSSQQYGDDADLMRRLERKKLTVRHQK
jgi:hypothetical protein